MSCACFFFVLGLGMHASNFDNDGRSLLSLDNPLGRIEAGYEFGNGIEVKIEHTSQVQRIDTGLNLLLVQKRWEWKP